MNADPTRAPTIMRRPLRDIAEGRTLGDTNAPAHATVVDAAVVAAGREHSGRDHSGRPGG